MNEPITIFCKSIIPSGSAFGIRMDTGDSVFIPASLTELIHLRGGEIVEAVLAPNKHKGSTTDWMAVRVSRIEEQEPPKPKPVMSIDDRAYSTIKISDGYLTTAEMAELLNTDSTIAHNALLRLFNQGKIAKADVYGSGGQSRPSFCLWAVSAKTFVGEEE